MQLKCEKPVFGWKIGTHKDDNGNIVDTITFSPNEALSHHLDLDSSAITFPCGKCLACLKRKRMEQALRITHEIEGNEENCFLTLTYNPESLPFTDKDGNVVRGLQEAPGAFSPTLLKEDYQLFMKRLRRHLDYHYGLKHLRYFIVGEYGTKGKRPHYHLLIFGWKPSDLIEHKYHGSYWTYLSQTIQELWPYGFIEVGINVNVGVAKYCAQYVTKKFDKVDKPSLYALPEFVCSSKMQGGLGYKFIRKFHQQIAEQGYILVLNRKTGQGFKYAIPKYYIDLIKRDFPDDWKILKGNRLNFIESAKLENEGKTEEYWLEFWNNYKQAKLTWKHKLKSEKRSFEKPT